MANHILAKYVDKSSQNTNKTILFFLSTIDLSRLKQVHWYGRNRCLSLYMITQTTTRCLCMQNCRDHCTNYTHSQVQLCVWSMLSDDFSTHFEVKYALHDDDQICSIYFIFFLQLFSHYPEVQWICANRLLFRFYCLTCFIIFLMPNLVIYDILLTVILNLFSAPAAAPFL